MPALSAPLSFSFCRLARLSGAALMVGCLWGPAVAFAEDVVTPFGTVSGTLDLRNELGAGLKPVTLTTINPVDRRFASAEDSWTFAVPYEPLPDYYAGRFSSNGYAVGGRVSVTGLPTLTPLEGVQAGEVRVTVEGTYATTGEGYLVFNPVQGQQSAELRGTGQFSFTRTWAELDALGGLLVSWEGAYPYLSGSDGSPAISSSVSVQLTGLKVSQSVTVVPEPSSWMLMGFGLIALGMSSRKRGLPVKSPHELQ